MLGPNGAPEVTQPERRCAIVEVSFACENCGADTAVAEAKRVGPLHVCRSCYEVAVEDGILADFVGA